MNKFFKYGFILAIAFIINSQFFGARNKQLIGKLKTKVAQQDGIIDSLMFTNNAKEDLVLELKETMLLRADSLRAFNDILDDLRNDYEIKTAINRYRTVAEFEGYLTSRYPNRQRSDSTKVAGGTNN